MTIVSTIISELINVAIAQDSSAGSSNTAIRSWFLLYYFPLMSFLIWIIIVIIIANFLLLQKSICAQTKTLKLV